MTDSPAPLIAIRPYAPGDHDAVRDICMNAGWRGKPASEFLDHPDLWADFWTGYYLACEPQHCRVATDPARRGVGYLTACFDSEAAERYAARRIVPRLAMRATLGGLLLHARDRAFLVRAARAARRGELAVRPAVRRRFPGHFHFNLLPEARGQGVGGRLYAWFEQAAGAAGLVGLHVQALASNPVVAPFLQRRGWREVERVRVRSLEGYLEPRVELVTLVKLLRPCR